MPPRIDPTRREITVGTRRVPFRLDLRHDQVSVTLGGAETAVRPLQWREKVTLARFAELGPEFLRDEVIRLCTVSELPATLAEEDAEVLWELAAWMTEVPASAPLPLDSRTLAAVTLRLCRVMGLRPADFDSRSAPEVEAMYGALGSPEDVPVAEESSPSASTTRIVIVPDAVPSPELGPVSTPSVPDAGRVSAQPLGPQRDRRSTHAAASTRAAHAHAQAQAQTQTPTPAQVQTQPQSIGDMAMISAATAHARSTVERTAIASPAHDVEPESRIAVSSWSSGLQPAVVATTTTAVEARRAEARRSTLEPETLLCIERVSLENSLALTAVEDRELAPSPDLFEELADRLEQAAAEMGLGEE